MKKTLFAFGFIFSITQLGAQTPNKGFLLSGEVIYREIVKMDIQLEGVDEEIAAQIPKERTSEKVLHFTEETALLENQRQEDIEEALQMESSGMMIKMYEPDNKTYFDLKNNKIIEQHEFMSRVFLIESDLEAWKWKMTGNSLEILGYACQEAISLVEDQQVHAWFTPEIMVPAGPGPYGGLPGLVLAAEMNDGDRKLEAVSIEIKPVESSLLKKPGKGKKVTREEFDALVAEKMKEMGVESDGSGAQSTHSVVIRIQQ